MESDLEATDMHANGLDGAAIHLTTRLRPFSCCPDATRCHTVAHKASSQKLSAIVVLCKFFERPHSVDAADLAWCTACARHEPKAAAIRGNHSSAQPACSALSRSRGVWPQVCYSACGARHPLRVRGSMPHVAARAPACASYICAYCVIDIALCTRKPYTHGTRTRYR